MNRQLLVVVLHVLTIASCRENSIEAEGCIEADEFCGEACFTQNYGNSFEEAVANFVEQESKRWNVQVAYNSIELNNVERKNGMSMSEKFYAINITEPPFLGLSDLISESGNHYSINWCPD